ncbi:hypothetical protein MAMC_01493 [Methylacidimicrobium cyclopophantes]|uniref:Methyltransferase domain-containing protein n=1 Tax=Methylacidimicrobium cyclopophantes TaxID=1041766 RepID=A0A5E6MDB5_9BACT|nr:class I SAM-dependent methyltransferase [Methylacidimicrobium cyclopophantes]VVM07201.1 hypothetical protein MAMC_01493 [Methylacidimicrobium cyclopophantes]
MAPFEMNSFVGKGLLALIRQGDYAHAGEEEAIDRVFGALPRSSERWLLDVGCGRGGTADYLRRGGWGRLVGLDRDATSLAYARSRYPEVLFVEGDVVDAPRLLSRKFAHLYAFNAFYAFPDQRAALAALREAAEAGAEFRLFDYCDRGGFQSDPLLVGGIRILPRPVEMERLQADLRESGWQLDSVTFLHEEYRGWYGDLLARIEAKRAQIVSAAGEEAFDYLRAVYGGILGKIEGGLLGGVWVRAAAA